MQGIGSDRWQNIVIAVSNYVIALLVIRLMIFTKIELQQMVTKKYSPQENCEFGKKGMIRNHSNDVRYGYNR
jgi:hypothetical protein